MKEGLDQGHDNRADRITKLEDIANLKAATLLVSQKIIKELVLKHHLSVEDEIQLNSDIEKALTNSVTNRKSSVRELAVETIRDTMKKRGLSAPGFRDEYVEELEERMKVQHS